jgi:hypothetical protein
MSSEQSKMQRPVPNWFVVSLFLQYQKLRKVQNAEGGVKVVCDESFSQHQELRTIQNAEGCPKLVCGESFLTTSGAENNPTYREGFLKLVCDEFFSHNIRSSELSNMQGAVPNLEVVDTNDITEQSWI